jgi:hypothetical protein
MSAAPIEAASLPWCGSHATKSRRKFLAKSKQWLSQHRHWKRRDQQKQLVMMLRGFYQYFGLHHCKPKLDGSGARCSGNGPIRWTGALP